MTKSFYEQSPPSAGAQLPGKDSSREAAKKSIERVNKALDRVFAEIRTRA